MSRSARVCETGIGRHKPQEAGFEGAEFEFNLGMHVPGPGRFGCGVPERENGRRPVDSVKIALHMESNCPRRFCANAVFGSGG